MHCRSRQPGAAHRDWEGAEYALLNGCGKTSFKPKHIKRLAEIGQFIHSGGRPFVFDGGRVGIMQCEAKDLDDDISEERSAAGARQGQRTWSGARRRPSASEHIFSSDALEAAFGTEFRILSQAYQVARFEREDGFWMAIRTKPLGPDGHQAHLLISVQADRDAFPKAWAFDEVGTRPRPFALKHTNFPDGSICAFDPASGVWTPQVGLLTLVDHYVIWMIKSWHRSVFGWWPGRQLGALPYYRAREFDPREFCGCSSGLLYGLCHQRSDSEVPEHYGRAQFEHAFGCSYSARKTPQALIDAARSKWRSLPPASYDFWRDL